MKRLHRLLSPWLLVVGWTASGLVTPPSALAAGSSQPSFFESMGASFKKGVDSVTSALAPKPRELPAQDPISLSTESKGGPELYVAMGKLYEQSGRKEEAVKAYEQALKLGARDAKTLSAVAQFKARIGELDESIRLYEQAAKLAPDDPSIASDLGLCFARQRRFPEAMASLDRAIKLQPTSVLYRNNIAAVLVEMGQPDEALRHLRTVHPEAAAEYNLGYLLNKKGQRVAAAQHFALALQKDPSLRAAKYWLDRIGTQTADSQPPSTSWPAAQASRWPPQQPVAGPGPAAPALAGPAGPTSLPMAAERAPLPPPLPNTSSAPAAPYPPETPAVGRVPSYPSEIRRQGFVEIVDDPTRAKTRRLPPARLPEP